MAACASAVGANGSVQITAVGTPRLSSSTPSCRLHELHEPQSPIAVTAMSAIATSSSISSEGAGRLALSFARITTPRSV